MPTVHEYVADALHSVLDAVLVQDVTRESVLPVTCPSSGLVNINLEDADEIGRRLGTGVREWSRVAEVEIVVEDPDETAANAALDAILAQIGAGLSDVTLGGAVEYLDLSAPVGADDIPMEGAATLKGAVVEVTLYYTTGNNPMETK